MLTAYQQATDVTVSAQLLNADGTALAPTSVTFEVLDELGNVVCEAAAASTDDSGNASATVAGADNTLAGDALSGVRVVRFTATTTAGVYIQDVRYIITAPTLLAPTVNTFCTLDEAYLAQLTTPNLGVWDMAAEAEQVAALITAWDRICRLRFQFPFVPYPAETGPIVPVIGAMRYDPKIRVDHLRLITPEQFAALPPAMQAALKRAQVIEANDILGADPVGDRRALGIASETVGESKTTFNTKAPLRDGGLPRSDARSLALPRLRDPHAARMIGNLLDEASAQARARYGSFLLGLRGVLAESQAADPLDARVFDTIQSGAGAVAQVYLDQEAGRFRADLIAVQKLAHAQAHIDVTGEPARAFAPPQAYGDEMAAWFQQELRAQAQRDANALMQAHRQMVLQATMSALARGESVTSQQGARTARIAFHTSVGGQPRFQFLDRSGRHSAAQTFVGKTYRHALLTFGVEAYVSAAAGLGAGRFAVVHPEPEHASNGVLFSLVDAPGAQTLASIRDDVFHPNSRAFVKALQTT